jgi:hypothetical protein
MIIISLRTIMKTMKTLMQVKKRNLWRFRIHKDHTLFYQPIIWRLNIMAIIANMKMERMKIFQ